MREESTVVLLPHRHRKHLAFEVIVVNESIPPPTPSHAFFSLVMTVES
jgi:hypothetical protein